MNFLINPVNVAPLTLGPGTGSGLGVWDAGEYYAVGDIVNYAGELYVSIQAGSGNTPGSTPAYWTLYNEQLPMDAISDPAVSAATVTAKIDAFSGTIITLTAAGNAQTLGTPTNLAAGKRFTAVNNDTSTNTIEIDGIVLEVGHAQSWMWDGSAWTLATSTDADQITYNPAASYLSDTNVQSAFDTVFTSDGILFTKGSQNYLFTDSGTSLALQSQTINTSFALNLFTKDGDGVGNEGTAIGLFGIGSPGATDDREQLILKFNTSTDVGEIFTEANGTGTLRPLVLYTEGNANQLYLSTDGNVGIGIVPRDNFEIASLGYTDQYISTFAATDAVRSRLFFLKSNSNILGTLSATNDGEQLGSVLFAGVNSAGTPAVSTAVSIDAYQVGATDASYIGGNLIFKTTIKGSSTATGMILDDDAMLDLYGGTISILAGAEDGDKQRRSGQNKAMRFAVPHYDEALPVGVARVLSNSTNNILYVGGNESTMLAPTRISFHVAGDHSTHTGTEVARFEGGAAKALMMGLGKTTLSNWAINWTPLQVGFGGALFSNSNVNDISMGSNVYFDNGSITSDGKRINADYSSFYRQAVGTHKFYIAGTAAVDSAISWVEALILNSDASATFSGDVFIQGENATGNTNPTVLTLKDADEASAVDQIVGSIEFEGADLGGAGVGSYIRGVAQDIAGLQYLSFGTGGAGSTVEKLRIASGANGLITLSGGTGGVRLDNTVGIGTVPVTTSAIVEGGNISGASEMAKWYMGGNVLTTGSTSDLIGLRISPSMTINHASAHDLYGVKLTNPNVTETLGTVGTSAMLYIDDAMSTSGTDYSIFVDAGRSRFDGFINHGPENDVTIASGVIAVTSTYNSVIVEGGAGAGADALTSATGGSHGDRLILKPNTSGASDQVTVTNGTGAGTFILAGDADFVMDHVDDRIELLHNGTEWVELSRSSNS